MDEKLKAWVEQAKAKLKELWDKNKILILILIPLLVLAKFRDLLINILVSSGKRLIENAKKKDASLKDEANSANNKANEIVENADKLSNNKPKVDEDWHKDE